MRQFPVTANVYPRSGVKYMQIGTPFRSVNYRLILQANAELSMLGLTAMPDDKLPEFMRQI
jgi:hypothetical protein